MTIITFSTWWIGGFIGKITTAKLYYPLSEELKDIPIRLSKNHDKRVVGALLAEMAQAHFDKNFDLRKEYEPLLYQLSKDSEIVMYAEA